MTIQAQMLLFPYDQLKPGEFEQILSSLRQHYWLLRSRRSNQTKYGRRVARRDYRRIEVLIKRLLECGMGREEVLMLKAHLRLKCGTYRSYLTEAEPCKFCVAH